MWWNICTSQVRTYAKRRITSKHKKFGIISGVVILTCALSWIPTTFVYYTGLYETHQMSYYVSLGLHYLITVTNPIVYILGTQGNVGQALVSTPVQYRRKISRSSMYNSETMHRNCFANASFHTISIADSIQRPSIVGRSFYRMQNEIQQKRISSSGRSSLDLISETEADFDNDSHDTSNT